MSLKGNSYWLMKYWLTEYFVLIHAPGQTGRLALSPRMDVSAGSGSLEGISYGTWFVVNISCGSGSVL